MSVCDEDCDACPWEGCKKVYRESSRYRFRSEEAKARQKELQKRKRNEAREKGYCIICRKRPATNGAKCYECYIRQKRYDQAKYDGRRMLWKANGLCYMCGKPTLPNKRLCLAHYDVARQNAERLNAHPNTAESRRRQKSEMQVLWEGSERPDVQAHEVGDMR